MKNNSQKGISSIITVILVLVIVGLTGVSVYFWQNYEKVKALNEYISANKPVAENLPKTTGADKKTDEKPIAPAPTPTPNQDNKNTPVVVYSPNGQFTAQEILELKNRFIQPFTDWNADNKISTVSIEIEKPNPPISGYKYKVSYINQGGSNGGFLYGTSTPLEWWLPECLNGCKFTENFKAKYPEIVAKTQ